MLSSISFLSAIPILQLTLFDKRKFKVVVTAKINIYYKKEISRMCFCTVREIFFFIYYYMEHLFGISKSYFTKTVSLPMRSMSFQGMTIRFFAESEASNPFPGSTMELISPVLELNSRSHTHPSKLPSRMFMTSLFLNSENVDVADIKAVCISNRRCLR